MKATEAADEMSIYSAIFPYKKIYYTLDTDLRGGFEGQDEYDEFKLVSILVLRDETPEGIEAKIKEDVRMRGLKGLEDIHCDYFISHKKAVEVYMPEVLITRLVLK